MHPDNGHNTGLQAMRDGPYQVNGCGYGMGKSTSSLNVSNGTKHQFQDNQPGGLLRGSLSDSPRMVDSSSQAFSGPEDNSTDPPDTCTDTSTLTYIDTHKMEESGENGGLRDLGRAEVVYVKVFVLIDDDDDGDMSLREKTVTDLSIMNGNAADLVGGRLLSTSSDSLFQGKAEPTSPEALPLREAHVMPTRQSCCFCSIL